MDISLSHPLISNVELECQHKWVVDIPLYRNNIQISSEVFPANNNEHKVKWQLMINFGLPQPTKGACYYALVPCIFLKLVSADGKRVRFKWELFSGNFDLQLIRVFNSEIVTVKPGDMQRGGFITGIKNNKLSIFVKITMMECTQPKIGVLTKEDMSSLIKDLGKLFNDVEFSDVTIIAGDSKFPVHKNILALRSDGFAAMLRHELEEKITNQIIINDFDSSVIREMLCYIYTGQSSEISKMTAELLMAADKYAVEGLKKACIYELNSKLDIETAVPTLISADLHGAQQLKQHAIDVINAHSAAIIKTGAFRDMVKTYPHLALEIFDRLQRSG